MMNLKPLIIILLFLVLETMQTKKEGTVVVEGLQGQTISALKVVGSLHLDKDMVGTMLIIVLVTKRR